MRVRNPAAIALAIVALFAAALASSPLQNAVAQEHRFSDPKKWAATFDDPERDKWQKPDEIIAALKLKPNDRVADIGAGTGYLAVRLARAVTGGIVYAVDIEENMVKHLTERAKASGITNIRGVVASTTSANLPEPVDVVVLLNVYHHIAERPTYFKRLKASLKEGARVAIIEYRPESPRGPPQRLRLSAAQIESEMNAAGYTRVAAHDFLPYQSFLVFQATTP